MNDQPPQTAADIASLGGKARAANLTPEERSGIARKAAEARWSAYVPKPEDTTAPEEFTAWLCYRPMPRRKKGIRQLSFIAAFFHPALAEEWRASSPHRIKDVIVKETLRIV